jgi:hypothetical protein
LTAALAGGRLDPPSRSSSKRRHVRSATIFVALFMLFPLFVFRGDGGLHARRVTAARCSA